jgi:hypothetical protein
MISAQMSDLLSSLARHEARDFDEAIAIQQRIIAETARLGQSSAKYYLALAMFLFECCAYPRSLERLQKDAAI